MDCWEGKVAIVTGASAGIGATIAEYLAQAGIVVVGLARRLDRLEELAAKLNGAKGKFYPKQCDVAKEEDILNLFKWVETEFGGVDILVNNAGVGACKKIIDTDNDSLRNILNVNVLAMAIATKIAVTSMKTRNVPGYIININSIVGHTNMSAILPNSLYTASKYAVTALTETVRQELTTDPENKIRITSISPGLVKTEILTVSGMPDSDQLFETTNYLEVIDIANAVLYVLGTPQHVLAITTLYSMQGGNMEAAK